VKKPGHVSTWFWNTFAWAGMKNLGFLPIYRSCEFLRLFLMMLLMKLSAIG